MEKDLQKSSNASVAKGLLQSEQLYNYILETSVFPREPGPLKELREVTANHPGAGMATAPDAGQLMSMLMKIINAKKTIEVGVFTGYSLLLTALSLPHDGKIVAIDVDREAYEMGLPIIKKAGVQHKIDFIESQALPVLDHLLEHGNEGAFDFAFVDADKVNYKNYHERLMKLVKVGGIIVYDNTLWQGTVAMTEDQLSGQDSFWKDSTDALVELNKLLAADNRVEISQAPLGDGITICWRVR
ncbi:caffeoyl-CoA O-methyltransferase [Tripterygium wilfordii]|uniref:Caffeoyl-CoA O-methyltransferase n=2 Tax=Tripterygium wilfordii TaxID=458696 RepID=A0A7J7C5W5_TRIWF|nr:probable caffeoyl-CoA O-methyltransferase At4g26220 isoform X1 [Tripterygium wilfordii]KAF5729543.1 caffeoyl-CoA O-methyltransferase [Tripterygium wilfordii]